MLKMDHYEHIRTSHRVYGKKIREIARDTGHSRNTVKKALGGEFYGYTQRRSQPYPVLGPYVTIIDAWLQADKTESKKHRHTAHRIYERFVEEQGHEKGGVEGMVGYARRNDLVPVPEAESLETLNQELLTKCVQYGAHQIHGRPKPVNAFFEQERPHLLRVPEPHFRNVQSLRVTVDRYATVRVDHNRYSVPTQCVGFTVQAL